MRRPGLRSNVFNMIGDLNSRDGVFRVLLVPSGERRTGAIGQTGVQTSTETGIGAGDGGSAFGKPGRQNLRVEIERMGLCNVGFPVGAQAHAGYAVQFQRSCPTGAILVTAPLECRSLGSPAILDRIVRARRVATLVRRENSPGRNCRASGNRRY
jgi:hypothetical protein